MDRYEVMAGKMTPLTDGAHRKWGFTGKVETRSYERLVDARSMIGDTTRRIASRLRTVRRNNGKKVVCIETGTVYETVRDAGIQVGKHPSSISHALSDGRTCAGYHWQYLDE